MNGRQERAGDVWRLSARSSDARIYGGRLPVVVAAGICQSSRRHCPEPAVSSTHGGLQASRPDISAEITPDSKIRGHNAQPHITSKSHTSSQNRNQWGEVDDLLDEQHVATTEPVFCITQSDGLTDKQGDQSLDALWDSEADWPRNYPMRRSQYFRDPKQALWGVGNGALKPTTSVDKTSKGLFACEVAVQIPSGDKWRTRAEMPKKTKAERLACQDMLKKLHVSGVLSTFFSHPVSSNGPKERNRKIDVYEYAAQFDSIPICTMRRLDSGLDGDGRYAFEANIELVDHDIRATGRGVDVLAADISASAKFMSEVRKSKSKPSQGLERMGNRYSNRLDSTLAEKFLVFVSSGLPELRCGVSTEIEHVPGMGTSYGAQIYSQGKTLGPPVRSWGKKEARELAILVAALTLKKREPELYTNFLAHLESGREVTGKLRSLLPPVSLPIGQDAVITMKEVLLRVREVGLPDEAEELLPDEDVRSFRGMLTPATTSPRDRAARNAELSDRLEQSRTKPAFEWARKVKENLPINQVRKEVLDQVKFHSFSIIIGATGCGKTTQTPQILLEDAIQDERGESCQIICTQPRRIAAMSVAERVAAERNEILQDSVGYHVRHKARLPRKRGSITYCTNGILLRVLQHGGVEILNDVSYLIIDEVHERSVELDFLMVLVKRYVEQRRRAGKPAPKVVFMSATVDAELFIKYFERTLEDGKLIRCPSLDIPGRLFPVEKTFLDTLLDDIGRLYPDELESLLKMDLDTQKYLKTEKAFQARALRQITETGADKTRPNKAHVMKEVEEPKTQRIDAAHATSQEASSEQDDAMVPTRLVALTIAHICRTKHEGSILVFLPGIAEIMEVGRTLSEGLPLGLNFNDESRYRISMLHSTLPEGNSAVFESLPKGCRQLILSTNVAETSITIPDVKHVVDCGKMRQKQYDHARRIGRLLCTWVSKSNSQQRLGRAGRVQNGNYYALFTEERWKSLPSTGRSEILRSELQEVCIRVRPLAGETSVGDFLSQAIQPPPSVATDMAVQRLKSIGAFTADEKLTPLGQMLAQL